MSASLGLTARAVSAGLADDDAEGRFADDGGASLAEGPSALDRVGRLRLLWAPPRPGQWLRGVWWPRSRDLAIELAVLLPAADAYLGGPVVQVWANPDAWAHQPRRLYNGRRPIRLAWFTSLDPATIGIGASPLKKSTLCVVPPEWPELTGRHLFRRLSEGAPWPAEVGDIIGTGPGIGDRG